MIARTTPAFPMWIGSGRLIDPWNLQAHLHQIEVSDLAQSLSRINRWTGHGRGPGGSSISVGAHTLICVEAARRFSRRLGLLALHHEDGECFFNDLPWAIKRHPAMAAYLDAEHLATRQCIDHFCPELRRVATDAIKPIDTACVMWEMDYFLPENKEPWQHPRPEMPLDPEVAYWEWPADRVAEEWVRLHWDLGGS